MRLLNKKLWYCRLMFDCTLFHDLYAVSQWQVLKFSRSYLKSCILWPSSRRKIVKVLKNCITKWQDLQGIFYSETVYKYMCTCNFYRDPFTRVTSTWYANVRTRKCPINNQYVYRAIRGLALTGNLLYTCASNIYTYIAYLDGAMCLTDACSRLTCALPRTWSDN